MQAREIRAAEEATGTRFDSLGGDMIDYLRGFTVVNQKHTKVYYSQRWACHSVPNRCGGRSRVVAWDEADVAWKQRNSPQLGGKGTNPTLGYLVKIDGKMHVTMPVDEYYPKEEVQPAEELAPAKKKRKAMRCKGRTGKDKRCRTRTTRELCVKCNKHTGQ